MDITCPQCKTEYEFEDSKVTEAGVTVKCTSCNFTFKVKRKAIVETEPVEPHGFTAQDASPSNANGRSWTVRSSSGQTRQFKELTTLQQWIVERKVTREDQISKSGESWKRLGDIAELSSFFQVVDAALAAEAQAKATSGSGAWSTGALASAGGGRQFEDAGSLGTSSPNEPAFAAGSADFAAVGPSAAWEGGGGRLPKSDEALEDEELPQRATGKLIGIIVVGVALVLGIALGLLNKDKLAGLFSQDSGQMDEAYQAGRKLLLMDDIESLKQADLQLTKAPADSALVQAARAEVYTTWAQHLREEAELLERHARLQESESSEQPAAGNPAPDPAAKPTPPAGKSPQALRLRASRLKDEADKKLIQAEAYARKAFKLAPERGEVKRAMADYLRLMGHNDQETAKNLEQMRQELTDDPEALYVEAAYWVDKGRLTRAETLLDKALAKAQARFGKRLLRASLLLALVELKTGRRDEARSQATAVLEANANHELAHLLLELVEAEDQAAAGAKPEEPAAAATTPEEKPASEEPQAAKGPAKDSGEGGGRAAPRTPASYDALVRQGNQLSERGGRTMQAFTLFERALKLNPSGVEALSGIGYCHLDQERFAAAISSFKRALSVSPTFGDALIGMAEAYKVQGNFTKSLDYYRAYLRAHPGGSKAILAQRNIADLERKTGATSEPPAPAPTPPGPGGAEPGQAAPAPSNPDPIPETPPAGGPEDSP